ncbi:TetR/AcrR family transcriptional regulator C-terminal domain-containing protein [Nesterenkonia sp. E16_7]|uniref:TetR/AcrR family transcriptional regulator n=1 Tax=unclassified Nesterenkonia TaxID=2629769 RepID=UPI001A9160F5|nr:MULTISPECIES: TetR/AcrR family transcriptional regulator [unclassified Nesterenkonia]MBO0596815.1 TetR/AcrR family transcriptional regulator C-terminal domain-containing protein [Nesterenkonia sp. E16_10]MBO0598233.1 TetR/AcrR family transcriptional regulator C-terminal domain-containing protein [Nesterenkonia sp. E16_7]
MADITDTGLPRAVTIAWGMQEVPQRGPNRGLSHARIVAAAMDIADAKGLSAVTMQAVAESLSFTTMSLYRYLSSKDELLRLMQDAAIQLPDKITLSANWKQALRQWAELIRAAYRAHPWVLGIPRGQTSVLMPNSVRGADIGLGALEGLNLKDDTKVGVILVVSQHVATMVELEQSLADETDFAVTAHGLEMLGEAITETRFPNVAALLAAGNYVPNVRPPTPDPRDEEEGVDADFIFGLDLIISGLEVLERNGSDVA